MPNYKQTTVSGEEWVRAGSVIISNPYNEAPIAVFSEQKLMVLDNTSVVIGADRLRVEFDINNPLHLAAYQALDAIYVQARELRDSAVLTP
jgi:hypothetical protein